MTGESFFGSSIEFIPEIFRGGSSSVTREQTEGSERIGEKEKDLVSVLILLRGFTCTSARTLFVGEIPRLGSTSTTHSARKLR